MEIKSLNEIKSILSKFKEASGVGYVIAPQLIKIAIQVGLVGYEVAMSEWLKGNIASEKVYQPGENVPNDTSFSVVWDGPSLCRLGSRVVVGIKRTIEEIELTLKNL